MAEESIAATSPDAQLKGVMERLSRQIEPKRIGNPIDQSRFSATLKTINWATTLKSEKKAEQDQAKAVVLSDIDVWGKELREEDHSLDHIRSLTLIANVRAPVSDPSSAFLSDLSRAALATLEQNTDFLNQRIIDDDTQVSTQALGAVSSLIRHGNEIQQKKGREIFQKNISKILQGVKSGEEEYKLQFTNFLELIVLDPNPKVSKQGIVILEDLIKSPSMEMDSMGPLLSRLYFSDNFEMASRIGDHYRAMFTKNFGTSFDDYITTWTDLVEPSNSVRNMEENISRMATLEKKSPGIVKFLTQTYDAHTFTKTSVHFLNQKYDEYKKNPDAFEPWLFENEALIPLGLNPKKLIAAWRQGAPEILSAAERNTKMILELERTNPGIAKDIHEEFGICYFARYPSNILIDQYVATQKDPQSVHEPYGIVLNARADWNGAFAENVAVFDQLYKQLNTQSAVAQKYGLKVMEVENKTEALKGLFRLRRKYGKASFGIIGGHGSKGSIQLGNEPNEGTITTDDLFHKHVANMRLVFEKNSRIVLNSCSTGAKEGFGQVASQQGSEYEVEVTGPEIPTALFAVHVERDVSGKLRNLKPQYQNIASRRTYYRGELKAA